MEENKKEGEEVISQNQPEVKKPRKTNIWKISTFVLLILLAISIFASGELTGGAAVFSNGNKVAEEALGYINTNLLQGQVTATLEDVKSENGVYKVFINVAGQSTPIYITKNGNIMFLQAIPLKGQVLNEFTNTNNSDNSDDDSEDSKKVNIDMALLEDDDPVLGAADAPVTIVEFSDFQCPYCASFRTQTFEQIKSEYIDTGKVKFVYRDFPLDFHSEAMPAAEAAECADEQGKFWEYHDKLFENQKSLGTNNYKKWAADLDLDTKKFNECLDSKKYKDEISKDIADGEDVGVTGTPAFIINGQLVSGTRPFSAFKQIIDQELAKQ